MMSVKIVLDPIGKEIEVDPNKSVLQLCNENGIELKSICKGVPSCAECRVRIMEGESNVLPPSKVELNLIGTSYYLDQRRLACQMICFGPVKIDISDHLEKSDSANKKLRGFKVHSQQQGPTQAKTGTLMLEEDK